MKKANKEKPEIDGLTFGVIKKEAEYWHTTVRCASNHDKNCGPIAISVLTGVAYDTVWSYMVRKGFTGIEGGTYTNHMVQSESLKGIFTQVITVDMMPLTVAGAAKKLDAGSYLIRVQGHVVALKNKVVWNTFDGGRRAKVKQIWRIENLGRLIRIIEQS